MEYWFNCVGDKRTFMSETKEDRQVSIEQYKLFAETTEKVSAKRSITNGFFVTINTSLIALFPNLLEKVDSPDQEFFIVIICSLGLLLNAIWFTSIKSYKTLNSSKFKVICAMEESLPFKPFTDEWKIIRAKEGWKKYMTLTEVELYIPFAMLLPYIGILKYYFC